MKDGVARFMVEEAGELLMVQLVQQANARMVQLWAGIDPLFSPYIWAPLSGPVYLVPGVHVVATVERGEGAIVIFTVKS